MTPPVPDGPDTDQPVERPAASSAWVTAVERATEQLRGSADEQDRLTGLVLGGVLGYVRNAVASGRRVGMLGPWARQLADHVNERPRPADDRAALDGAELLDRACRFAEDVVFGDHPEDAPGTVRDGLAVGWIAGYRAASGGAR